MKLFSVFCLLAVVCSSFGAPDVENNELLDLPSRNLDFLLQTRKLVEDLVGNLRKSAQEALNSVSAFNAGIMNEAKEIRDKIISDLQKFRLRVQEAVDNVMNRISSTGGAVKECVDSHRSAAAAVFNETLSSTMSCVDERIAELSKEIQHLKIIANDAMTAGSQAIEDMKKCTTNNTSLWTVGSCLGTVAVKTEVKSAGFLGQSTLTVGRINLGIASLPASLEICAGMRLLQAGVQTGKIIVEVGGCSATGIFNTIIGKPVKPNVE